MSLLSWILGGIILAYTAVYGVKRYLTIMKYLKAEKNGELKIVDGIISAKTEEENKAFQGEMVNVCYPKYEYEKNGEKKSCQSTVRYCNASIGQPVKIGYCERTEEAWAIKDIPLMKKNLIIRIAVILFCL